MICSMKHCFVINLPRPPQGFLLICPFPFFFFSKQFTFNLKGISLVLLCRNVFITYIPLLQQKFILQSLIGNKVYLKQIAYQRFYLNVKVKLCNLNKLIIIATNFKFCVFSGFMSLYRVSTHLKPWSSLPALQ